MGPRHQIISELQTGENGLACCSCVYIGPLGYHLTSRHLVSIYTTSITLTLHLTFNQVIANPHFQEDEYSYRPPNRVPPSRGQSAMTNSPASQPSVAVRSYNDRRSASSNSPAPAKTKIDRMFGDSVQSSPLSSVGRNAGGSLSSLYQARKANDSATVEQIKQHFQKQIEAMLQSSQRHEVGRTSAGIEPPPQFSSETPEDRFRHKISVPEPPPPTRGSRPLPARPNASAPSDARLQNIQRGKSFLEARSKIEKMFVATTEEGNKTGQVKHSMHGVSHITPQEEEQYNPPPPVHHGVNQALMSRQEHQPQSFPSSRASQQTQQQAPDGQGTLGRRHGTRSMTSLTSTVTLNNSIVDIGNIDMSQRREKKGSMDRTKRASMHESSPDAPVPMRDRKRIDSAAINRRISIHQDKFDLSTPETLNQEHRKPAETRAHFSIRTPQSSKASDSESQYEPILSPPSSEASSKIKTPPQKYVKHRIEYLGAVPLGNKATNLAALQMPLKELYFKNKALQSLGHSNLPGTLEISDTGMKIQYIREMHKGVQEIFNSFPTIAVWAAVKFVHKSAILPSGERRQKFSFLPLISDPESTERRRTYYDLDYEEVMEKLFIDIVQHLT